MSQLRAFRTVGTAYRFVFSNLPTIVRLTWFPLFVVAIVGFGLNALGLTYASPGAPIVPAAIFGGVVAVVVQVAASAMVAVAVHRLILFNDQRPGAAFLFSFGRTELLFVAFWAIIAAVCALLGLLYFAMLFPIVAGAGGGPESSLALAAFVVMFVLALIGLFVSVRLVTIYPIIVVEDSLNFRESWQLSRGKFWRQFWTLALGMLPIGLIAAVIGLIITLATLDRTSALTVHESMRRALPLTLAWQFVVGIVVSGLGVALICFSYKSLRGLPPDAIVPQRRAESATNTTATP